MSKDLNVNRRKNVNTTLRTIKVFPPAVTEPSVLDTGIITSQPSGAPKGNLREARAPLWLSAEGGELKEQKGIFLYLTSEHKQCNSLQTCRCLWVFFIQNTEGRLVQELCKNVVRGRPAGFLRAALPYHVLIISGLPLW